MKIIAILIGAEGLGLATIYQGIFNIASTAAGLGIRQSGVREVVKAAEISDSENLARIVLTLKRVCWLTGAFGCLLVYMLAPLISRMSFSSEEYIFDIRLLGLTILFGNIAAGQGAVIQGMRRISDLAMMGIISTAVAAVVASLFYFFWKLHGIAPAMLAMSIVTLAISTLYSRRIPIKRTHVSWLYSLKQAFSLAGLGLAIVWTSLISMLVTYLTYYIVRKEVGLEAVGLYSAAFSISGMFVGFVLQAMGNDYYPRLTQKANNASSMNQLINEQTEIGILIALPGIILTISLAPFLIWILFSDEFLSSVILLQWFAAGCLGRIISWPLGYAILAKGKGAMYAFVETAFHLTHISLIYFGVSKVGIEGGGIAFVILYSMYIPVVFLVVRGATRFNWSKACRGLIATSIITIILIFICSYFLPSHFATALGVFIALVTAILCLRGVVLRTGRDHQLFRIINQVPFGSVILGRVRE